MIALAGSGDITVALEGSVTSLMEEPEKLSLRKWKQLSIRITAIHRFSRKYNAKSFIVPGLTAASPQVISKVKKSNTSEGSQTRNLLAGALFSPNTAIQDAPKQKFNSEKKNGEGYSFKLGDVFKDHRVLSPIQILVTGLTSQIKEADLLGRRIIVTVISLASRQEGTTATYNHVVWTVLKGLFFLLWLSTFKKIGANDLDDSEDGNLERLNDQVDLLYNAQAAASTILAGIFMIAVIAGRMNRRHFVPVRAAAPLAVPPPAAVPVPAIPVPAVPVPAVPVPAVPVPAIPMGFIDVMDGLEDPTPTRRSDLNFHIPSRLQED